MCIKILTESRYNNGENDNPEMCMRGIGLDLFGGKGIMKEDRVYSRKKYIDLLLFGYSRKNGNIGSRNTY